MDWTEMLQVFINYLNYLFFEFFCSNFYIQMGKCVNALYGGSFFNFQFSVVPLAKW